MKPSALTIDFWVPLFFTPLLQRRSASHNSLQITLLNLLLLSDVSEEKLGQGVRKVDNHVKMNMQNKTNKPFITLDSDSKNYGVVF